MKEEAMTLEKITGFIGKMIYDWIYHRINNKPINLLEPAEELMDKGWSIQVEGYIEDLDKLSNMKIKNLTCFNINENYFIRHEKFEEFEDVEDILYSGSEIISVLNGIGKINLNLKGNIKLLGASRELRNEKGKPIHYKVEDLESEIVVGTPLNKKERCENSIDKWIQLTEMNEYIYKLFRLLNYELTCINIWRIIELIKKDLGNNYTYILETAKKEINRLKRSVDNPEVSGDLARHGVYNGEAIPNPMELNEASLYIYNLIYKWIHYRVKLLEQK